MGVGGLRKKKDSNNSIISLIEKTGDLSVDFLEIYLNQGFESFIKADFEILFKMV